MTLNVTPTVSSTVFTALTLVLWLCFILNVSSIYGCEPVWSDLVGELEGDHGLGSDLGWSTDNRTTLYYGVYGRTRLRQCNIAGLFRRTIDVLLHMQ